MDMQATNIPGAMFLHQTPSLKLKVGDSAYLEADSSETASFWQVDLTGSGAIVEKMLAAAPSHLGTEDAQGRPSPNLAAWKITGTEVGQATLEFRLMRAWNGAETRHHRVELHIID